MTIRRLNYTDCQRIGRADVQVIVDRESTPPAFTYECSLDEYGFPPDANVVIEAYAHWTLMRFDCGSISASSRDDALSLVDFDSPDGIKFRLKVIGVGESAGLILGEADGIHPVDSEGREDARSFLAVQPADLGHVVWQLSFADSEPLLQINEKIGDWRSFMRRVEVRTLLVPELFRQLLFQASVNPADVEAEDAWQQAVLKTVPPGVGSQPPADDRDALERWVDAAVRKFAAHHKLWNSFVNWSAVGE